MVSNRQRRKALARAKWERQQARRTASQQRTRRVNIIAGAAVSVVAAVALGWGVYALIQNSNSPATTTPTYTDNFPSLLQPTSQGPTAYSLSPGSQTTGQPTTTPQTPQTPTAPATTESTGR